MTWVKKHCRKRYTEEEILGQVSLNDKRKREVSPNDKASLVLTTRLDEWSPSDKSMRC